MIKARFEAQDRHANLEEYESVYRSFSWAEQEKYFTWPESGRVNIAYEAVDRWAEDPEMADHAALIFDASGEHQIFSFRELKEKSSQMANLFLDHGLKSGDRFFIYLAPCPELYLAMLACARLGVVFAPLFSTLSYSELEVRLKNGAPAGLLTHPDLCERLPTEVMSQVGPIFLTGDPTLCSLSREEVPLQGSMARLAKDCPMRWPGLDASLYLLYTSGSTGPPKGVLHAHGDMLGHLVTARYVLDLKNDSVLWTDGSPAWVTGAVYGAFAPWLCGVTSVVQCDPFSASKCYRTLEQHRVSVWYTTPGRIKSLMGAGEDLPGRYDLSSLRHIATVGESLSPDLFYWVKKNLGLTPHDTWWMTETGMICLANFPSMATKPGALGKPVPGVSAAILDEQGHPLPVLSMGELALKPSWPAMMIGIWKDEQRYRDYFRFNGWFVSGDMAIQDEEGYFYHQGRNDDLIKVGDQMVGPFEVERVLGRHPAVAEAAVIAKSIQTANPHIKAFVTLRPGFTSSTRLNLEIKEFVKANMSSAVPLREVAFVNALPKTRSGKLLRRVLRAGELGLPAGDVANMQD